MNSRPIFNSANVSPRAAAAINSYQLSTLAEIEQAIASNDVVVIGMARNPFVKKARAALTAAGVTFKYLEYGTYFNNYSLRVAIKMWTGWATFPQIFVKGIFIGGFDDLSAEMGDGTFQKRIAK